MRDEKSRNSEAERETQDGMKVPGSSSIRTQKAVLSSDDSELGYIAAVARLR